MIEAALLEILGSSAPLTAVVSTRIFLEILPERTTLPAVVYRVLITEHEDCQDGRSLLATSRVELEVFGSTGLAARDMAELVRQALHGFTGTVGGRKIHAVIDWSSSELFEDEEDIWDATCQCSIWHDVPA